MTTLEFDLQQVYIVLKPNPGSCQTYPDTSSFLLISFLIKFIHSTSGIPKPYFFAPDQYIWVPDQTANCRINFSAHPTFGIQKNRRFRPLFLRISFSDVFWIIFGVGSTSGWILPDPGRGELSHCRHENQKQILDRKIYR